MGFKHGYWREKPKHSKHDGTAVGRAFKPPSQPPSRPPRKGPPEGVKSKMTFFRTAAERRKPCGDRTENANAENMHRRPSDCCTRQ